MHKFKVGDRVRILKAPPSPGLGWCKGKAGTIKELRRYAAKVYVHDVPSDFNRNDFGLIPNPWFMNLDTLKPINKVLVYKRKENR